MQSSPLPPLSQLVRATVTFFFVGVSVAAAFHFGFSENLRGFIESNALSISVRKNFLKWAAGSGALASLLPCLYLLRQPNARGVAAIGTLADVVSPAMLAWALPFFFRIDVFLGKELLCVTSATIFSLLLERTLRRSFLALYPLSFGRNADVSPLFRPSRWLIVLTVGGLTLFFVLYFGYYTVLHHYQLETRSYDLAIFDNMMWNLIRGEWFKSSPVLGRIGSHLRYHATFDAYLFAPFYALRQKADTLLVLQALVTGLGVIPIYLLTRRVLLSALCGLAFAYAYVIHAPQHGAIFYDFHFITTAPFWVGWVLYFFETRRNGWLALSWVGAVLLREEQSAGIAMACFFYLLSGKRPVLALWGGLVSAALFLLIKFVIMPAHSPGGGDQAYTYIFAGLIPPGESGFGAVLRTVFTNPIFTLNTLLIPDKFAYFMKTLAPVLFLPVRNPRAWVLLLPAAVFTLLSTGYMPVIETHFQYTSNWTAYLFFASAVTLAEWKAKPDGNVRIAAAMTALVVTATAMSYHYGAIFQRHTFRGGFSQVSFSWTEANRRNLNDLYALIAMIPKGASVAASETEAPHVSNRADCFTMRGSVEDPDYLLVNVDEVQGGESRQNMLNAMKSGRHAFIASRGRFALWGKNWSHEHDAEGRALLKLEADP